MVGYAVVRAEQVDAVEVESVELVELSELVVVLAGTGEEVELV